MLQNFRHQYFTWLLLLLGTSSCLAQAKDGHWLKPLSECRHSLSSETVGYFIPSDSVQGRNFTSKNLPQSKDGIAKWTQLAKNLVDRFVFLESWEQAEVIPGIYKNQGGLWVINEGKGYFLPHEESQAKYFLLKTEDNGDVFISFQGGVDSVYTISNYDIHNEEEVVIEASPLTVDDLRYSYLDLLDKEIERKFGDITHIPGLLQEFKKQCKDSKEFMHPLDRSTHDPNQHSLFGSDRDQLPLDCSQYQELLAGYQRSKADLADRLSYCLEGLGQVPGTNRLQDKLLHKLRLLQIPLPRGYTDSPRNNVHARERISL